MKFLKRINLIILVSLVLSLAPVSPVQGMQNADQLTVQFESAAHFLKNIFTLDYLNGDNGEHRNVPFFEKITRQPERALATAAVFGFTAFLAKKLYDLALKHDIFGDSDAQAQPREQRPAQSVAEPRIVRPEILVDNPAPNNRRPSQYPQNNQHSRHPQHQSTQRSVQPPFDRAPLNGARDRQGRPFERPSNFAKASSNRPFDRAQDRQNNVPHIAQQCPLPGQQINILQRLPGFFHMASHTLYEGVNNSCGVQAVYNMALVEAHVFGRNIDNNEFRRVQQAVYPQLDDRGTVISGGRGGQVGEMVRRLGLSRMTVLANAQRQTSFETLVNEFRNNQGPCVLHFLCKVPNHGVAISVAKYADGTQAMYLHDNMNYNTPHREALQRHVETIYNRFF